MTTRSFARRDLLKGAAAGAAALAAPSLVLAQETPVRFTLDWRFEGPSAPLRRH